MKPIVYDLYCGLGGWADGFLAEGYRVIGFDNERHVYGEHRYPGELVIQDIRTLHGSQLRNGAVIVASPPCQKYSSRAMPWNRLADGLQGQLCAWGDDGGNCEGWLPLEPIDNTLFRLCFRLQREASESAGRYIPLVVENVKGAQRWVGPAAWHHGSFYLWGDVPALMPMLREERKSRHDPLVETPAGTGKTSWFFGNSKHEARYYGLATKNEGGSWFAKSHNRCSPHNPDGRKTMQHINRRNGAPHTKHLTNSAEHRQGVKQTGSNEEWFDIGICNLPSNSRRRREASALIAKIPFELSSHIARVFKPDCSCSQWCECHKPGWPMGETCDCSTPGVPEKI